ncbi:MAG: ferredoxin reductase family protein [Acidimicrobiales bacterium]
MQEHDLEIGGATHGGFSAVVQGFGWVALYGLVAITPLVVVLTANPPPGRDWWLELSVGLGFVGLSLMGLQFAAVSRFAAVNAPFGLDAVLQYHRVISFTAMAFVLAHPAIIVIRRPGMVDILNPITTHWTARFGIISIVSLLVLVATSLWRRRLGLSYEVWRITHGLLAVLIIVTALLHIWGVGYYVDGPWKQGLWLVMSAVFVALLVNVRVIKPLRLLRRPWEVVSVREEPGRIWDVRIRPVGHRGIDYIPGQFAWLRIDRGPFAVREHPFSFSSSAESDEEVWFSIKESGDFTSTIGTVEPGTRVYLDGPYGVFSYERNEGPDFVFIAGGVGIAPMLSMLRTLADRGDRRPCLVLYGNERWDEVAHRDDLDDLASRLDLTVVHVINDPPDAWDGEAGLIDADLMERHLGPDPQRSRYFICGPPPMMDAVVEALEHHDVPLDHVDLERFDLV